MRVALHRSEQERHPAVVQHVGLREPRESQTALRANQGEQGRRVNAAISPEGDPAAAAGLPPNSTPTTARPCDWSQPQRPWSRISSKDPVLHYAGVDLWLGTGRVFHVKYSASPAPRSPGQTVRDARPAPRPLAWPPGSRQPSAPGRGPRLSGPRPGWPASVVEVAAAAASLRRTADSCRPALPPAPGSFQSRQPAGGRLAPVPGPPDPHAADSPPTPAPAPLDPTTAG